MENKNATVFTYREIADNFFSTSPDSASETQHFAQEEVGGFNLLYLFSSLGVLLGRILHFGFVPTLFLGRLFNIVFYALITSLAIKLTPDLRLTGQIFYADYTSCPFVLTAQIGISDKISHKRIDMVMQCFALLYCFKYFSCNSIPLMLSAKSFYTF